MKDLVDIGMIAQRLNRPDKQGLKTPGIFITRTFEDKRNQNQPSAMIITIDPNEKSAPRDPTVTIPADTSTFIDQESCVLYRELETLTIEKLKQDIEPGKIVLGQRLSNLLLIQRIIEGIDKTPFKKEEEYPIYKEYQETLKQDLKIFGLTMREMNGENLQELHNRLRIIGEPGVAHEYIITNSPKVIQQDFKNHPPWRVDFWAKEMDKLLTQGEKERLNYT